MDFYSLGFIFVIVMVSGVIAYLADIWGRKLGKRRLSLFGLRPRHTATVGIMVLGMGIAMSTILLTIIFSAPVRHWILDGSKALNELNGLQRQLTALNQQIKSEKAEMDRARQEKLRAQNEIANYKQVENQNEMTLGNQKTQIQTEQRSISNLKIDQARLTSDLHQTRLDLSQKSQAIKVDEIKIDETDRKLKKNQSDLDLAKKDYSEKSKAYKAANVALMSRNNDLQDAISKQQNDVQTLQQQRHDLLKSSDDLRADLDAKKIDLKELDRELQQENEALTQLKREDGFATYNAWLSRVAPMTYSHLEEVCRLSEPANLNSDSAQAAIDSLVRRAQLETQSHVVQGYKAKTADVMDRPDGTTAEQIKAMLKDKLTGKPEETVLIASAGINTFADEPVPLEITIAPNPTVYRKGENIGEFDVDGNGSAEKIIQQLTDFGSKLRERARRDKMIPTYGDDYGSLPADQVLHLVDQVRQAGRRVRLQAMVAEDTHAADPLKLNFRIR